MKFFLITLLFFAYSTVNAAKISTLYEKTTPIGNGMSMTVQLKESDGPIVIPTHTHPSPATAYLISGDVVVDFDGDIREFNADDVWIEPALLPHSGSSSKAIKYFVVYHHPSDQPYRN